MFQPSSHLAITIPTLVVAVVLATQPVGAEDISEEQILSALSPPRTPSSSLGKSAPPAAFGQPERFGEPARSATSYSDAGFINAIRNKSSSLLSAAERNKLAALSTGKPNIDLTMEFEHNSTALRGETHTILQRLGKALQDSSMKDETFVIAGHTDAKGAAKKNQDLSERRADAVKRFLVDTYQVPAVNLITVGYGETRLKDIFHPFAKENRRVQAVNLLQLRTAGR